MNKTICVYCGSSVGNHPIYTQAMQTLAREMVQSKLTLVYGGGKIGLMGVLADEMLALGGKVIGVIPKRLNKPGIVHEGLTQMHVMPDMHTRKALMAELADGFIAAPGGIGTMDEFFEILVWAQLNLHNKPIALFNVDGFYDLLTQWLAHLTDKGFSRAGSNANKLIIESQASRLIPHFLR